MNHWQIIRIVLALCGIFAAGIITGRFTAPQAPLATIQQDGRSTGQVTVQTGEGLTVNAGQIIRFYTRSLGLSTGQRTEIIPLIRHGMVRIQKTRPASTERREAIRALTAELRPVLTPDQQKKLDEIAAASEKTWAGETAEPDSP
jgi:hypothetical protein